MKIITLGLYIVSLFASSAACASEWWLVDVGGNKPNRTVIFIDKAGIRQVGSRLQVWQSNYYEHPTPAAPAFTEKQLLEYDCSARTTSLVSWIEYDKGGNFINSKTYPQFSREVHPAAPDTVADSELTFVCGEKSSAFKIDNLDPIATGIAALNLMDAPVQKR